MDATATTVAAATAATGGTTTGATGADPALRYGVGAYLNPDGRGRRPPDAGPYSCASQRYIVTVSAPATSYTRIAAKSAVSVVT
jgi:hypothetical protein